MLQTLPRRKAVRPVSIRERAQEWLEIYNQISELKEQQKAIAAPLLAHMMARGTTQVDAGGGSGVMIVSSKSKRPAKKDVVAFFGKKRGEEFWEEMPDSTSTYLSPITKKA
jgi:hypothetical protein